MQYLPEQDVVVISLVDLEHCGFDYEMFANDNGCAASTWPVAVLVNFAGGCMITPNTAPVVKERIEKSNEKFEIILEAVKGMDIVSCE